MPRPRRPPIVAPGGSQELLRAIVDDCLVLVLLLESSQGQTPHSKSLRQSLVTLSLQIRQTVAGPECYS